MIIKKTPALFLFLLTCTVNAQPYKWTNYTVGGNTLYGIASDSENVWVGSSVGLVKIKRADNSQSLLNLSDSANFPADVVYCISPDTAGNLWISTNKGLVKFKKNVWQVYNKSNSAIPSEIIGLVNARQTDTIWFTYSDCVARFNGTTFDTVRLGSGIASGISFYGIESDVNKNIWVSTSKGLYLIDHQTLSFSLIRPVSNAITIDSSGNILACVYNTGIIKYKAPLYNTTDTILFAYPWLNYYSIKTGNDSTLWLNSDLYLFKYRKGIWENVTSAGNLLFPGDNFISVNVDDSSHVWLLANHKGLIKHTEVKSVALSISTLFLHLLGNSTTSVSFDRNNSLWITYSKPKDRISCKSGEKWKSYSLSDSAALNTLFSPVSKGIIKLWMDTAIIISFNAFGDSTWFVADIANKNKSQKIKMDYDTLVWIATTNGLKCFNKGVWTIYDTNNTNLPVNKLGSVTITPENDLLICTMPYKTHKIGYVYSGKIGSLKESCQPGGAGNQTNYFPSSIVYDADATLWMGVYYLGVYNSKNGFSSGYNKSNSKLPDNSVVDLNYGRKEKQLWIGTESGGLATIDSSGEWKVFDKNNSPLLFNSITNVVISKDSSIWLAVRFNGLAHLIKNPSYIDTIPVDTTPVISCKASFTYDTTTIKKGDSYQTQYQFYDHSTGGDADISEYPFEAIMQGRNSDCGVWAISFTSNLDSVHSICGMTVDGSTYIARNLPDELKMKGLKIRLKIRKPGDNEIGGCTDMGPSYSWTYVIKAILDTNKQALITSRLWDFGDDSISGIQNPKHVFPTSDKTYAVCLTITTADSCIKKSCRNITSPPTDISSGNDLRINIYPIPTTGIINLTGDNIIKTEVFDITARPQGVYYGKQLDLSSLPAGIYLLSIYGKEGLLKKEKIILSK